MYPSSSSSSSSSPSSSSTLVHHLFLLLLSFNIFRLAAANTRLELHLVVEPSCPLNFQYLRDLVNNQPLRPVFRDTPSQCQFVYQGLRLLRAEYLRLSANFFPPPESHKTCWQSYRKLVSGFLHGFDIETSCNQVPNWVFSTCMNITTRKQFEGFFPGFELQETSLYCNRSLEDGSACSSCNERLQIIGKKYMVSDPEDWKAGSECSSFLSVYAAGIINGLGPSHPGTAECFFGLHRIDQDTSKRNLPGECGVIFGVLMGVTASSAVIWFLLVLVKNRGRRTNASSDSELGSPSRSTQMMVEFDIEEIERATMSFSRENLIGSGKYGNVYKGVLSGGREAAFKRFKNCSASGDADFTHEVEIIASVRHVNLVAPRGYCIATVPLQGHQRVIVYDLMRNGSLHDHLFGSGTRNLSWPIRHKITLGTARGLAYLHNGIQPAIIHRDIKASNILLDESFEPKVADFGLAKLNSLGTTHLSTRVAGTFGYLSPEYALYGKLTDKSDVYSFGVLLLELLSGRKAYENKEGGVALLSDWAWNLVKAGKTLDVLEERIPDVGSPQLMEIYVHLGVICAHPILAARPTIDQVVKILESHQLLDSSGVGAYISTSTSAISTCTSSPFSTTGEEPHYT